MPTQGLVACAGPEGGGWYRLTWLTPCHPPVSVPTPIFWRAGAEMGEVGPYVGGWHGAGPAWCGCRGSEGGGWYRRTWLTPCQPPVSVPTPIFWRADAEKGEVGPSAGGWHGAGPAWCGCRGPEGGGWYRLTWLTPCQPPVSVPTPIFWRADAEKGEVGPSAGGWHGAGPTLSGSGACRYRRTRLTPCEPPRATSHLNHRPRAASAS